MTILDANILLYAYNADAQQHSIAAAWVEDLFRSREEVGIPWITLWAFLRISTNPRLWPNPNSTAQSFRIMQSWLDAPGVFVVEPGPRHAEILQKLVTAHRVSGPLITDAALAALALEYGATLASTDRDFGRFLELRWINPAP